MSLLTIITDAIDQIGLEPLTSVVGNSDPTARAFLRAFTAEGNDLLTEDPSWSTLIREYEFDTADQIDEYALPEDFQRMITNTAWDRAQFWQIRGGITPQQWQVIRSGLYQTARLSANFRLKQGADGISKSFFLDPIPGGVRTLVYEYYSKWWVYDPTEGNIRKARPTKDSDEIVYNEELVTRGVIWRWLRMRKLPFATELQDYKDLRGKLIAQDRSPPSLTVNEQPWRLPIGNVPDTGFGIS